jgi:hypothetical protein
VAEGAAIANTFNVADRLRSGICLPTIAASFHKVHQHTSTIGHPGDLAEDQMARTSGDSVSSPRPPKSGLGLTPFGIFRERQAIGADLWR